jgi:hypothetical protein
MIKFKPENLNDTFRTFPRTLMDAFPEEPEWVEPTPLHEVVLYGLAAFAAGLITLLLILGY